MDESAVSCFCHQALQKLPGQAAEHFSAHEAVADVADGALARALADWLGARALPAAAWQPDPAWRQLTLPSMKMSASAMATVSAMAQLRAQALAEFGIDLLEPAQAKAFVRLTATIQARVQLVAPASGMQTRVWSRLAATHEAVEAVRSAISQKMLPRPEHEHPDAKLHEEQRAYQPLLKALGQLAPLAAAARQLDVDISAHFTAELAAKLRVVRALPAPVAHPASALAAAQLTAGLSAVARLRAALGVEPLAIGVAATRAIVAARAAPILQVARQHLGMAPFGAQAPHEAAESARRALAALPHTPYCASSLATRESVRVVASIHAEAVAQMDWQVPALEALPAVQLGLSTFAFAAQLQAATGVDAVRRAPCGSSCDAAALGKAA